MADLPTDAGRAIGGLDAGALLDALPRAIIVTNGSGRILGWNVQAERLYGWNAEEVLGRDVREILVPVTERALSEEILAGVREGNAWSGDFTVMHRDGSPMRVWVSDQPIVDESGSVVAIVAASEDVTDLRLMEQANADLSETLRLAVEAGELGTFRWDMATGATEWDEHLEAMFGLPPGGFDGTFDGWIARLHPEDRDRALGALSDAVANRERYVIEHRVVWPDGTIRWVEGSGQPTLDAEGNVTGAIGCTRDITDRVLAETERQRFTLEAIVAADQERAHRERLEFLVGVNEALASATDRQEVMVNIAHAAVPRLGDWCSIYVLPHPGDTIPEVETAHVDPEMVAYARRLQDEFPYDPDALSGIAQVIRTGRAEFHPWIDEAVLADADASDAAKAVVRELRLSSSMAVPLIKKGRVLGALQLMMTGSRRRYTEDDFTMAQAVAARIASNLENQRLHDEQRSIASALQSSLLPARLPEIAGIDTAVRYWANGDNVEVGGDFYDLFTVDSDRWAVVIGDVCGTGPAAAAVTGLARHTIASSAWHGDDHRLVLQNLNGALRARELSTFCTAVYGTLEPAVEGSFTFTSASAGHPLPILVRAAGDASTIGTYGRLAGLFDDIETTPTTVIVHPGDTVVLYTDGATDVAPPHGLAPEDFQAMVANCAHGADSAETVVERLHRELVQILPIAHRHDDIAILVIRVQQSR